MDWAKAKVVLEKEEDRVPWAYQDSKQLWTIGVGHLIDHRAGGRISDKVIDILLEDDMQEKWAAIVARSPFVSTLDDARQFVVLSMGFQLGTAGLYGFHNFWIALQQGDYQSAAREILDSDLARKDAPARAARLAEQMRSGIWQVEGGQGVLI